MYRALIMTGVNIYIQHIIARALISIAYYRPGVNYYSVNIYNIAQALISTTYYVPGVNYTGR